MPLQDESQSKFPSDLLQISPSAANSKSERTTVEKMRAKCLVVGKKKSSEASRLRRSPQTNRLKIAVAIPVAWTFMSEILTKQGRIIERLSRSNTIASTVFYGHAIDMNVHPAFGRFGIAAKT